MRLGKKAKRGTRVKKLVNGGNGDPTKDQRAVAESTATPNYAERALLNYAGLLPEVNPPFLKDEGTIRQTPENEPTMLQSFYEGTPLGMTEEEKYEPFDKMSIIDVAAEPLKALEYYSVDANKGRLPTRAEWDSFGGSNVLDAAVAMVNPAAYVSYAMQSEAGALALLPAFRPAMNAYQTSLRANKALGAGKTPMNFTNTQNRQTQLALESAEVNDARVALSQNLSREVSQVQKAGTTLEQRQEATNQVLDFYNRYLSTPAALEKIQEHRRFKEAAARAVETGDLSKLYSDDVEIPKPPSTSTSLLTDKDDFIKSTPYFIGRSPLVPESSMRPYGRSTSFLRFPRQEGEQDVYMLRSRVFGVDADGAPETREQFFSNTVPGRKAAAEALINNFKIGSQSARDHIVVTLEQMKAFTDGAAARGATKAMSDISRTVSDFTGNPVEFRAGMPVQTGPYRYNFSEAQIRMLDELTPEEFLNTLTHETNHNMLLPFLDQLADMEIIEMHTIGSTRLARKQNIFGRDIDVPESAGSEFRSAEQIDSAFSRLTDEILDMYPRASREAVEEHIQYLGLPHEIQARLWEIKQVYAKIADENGIPFEQWQYQFNADMAEEALGAWQETKPFIEGDIFELMFVGDNPGERMRTLASVLNKTFTPAIGIGTAAVATKAKIDSEEAPTINKRGGLVKKLVKKKRRGYRSV